MQNFQGKTAFITGAGSGIGLGMARTFARNGMNIVLCDIRRDALDDALAQVNKLGAQAIAIEVDTSVRASVDAATQQALDAFGKVHVLCNNAGISMHGVPIEKLPVRDWEWVMGVNINGVIHGFQNFIPHMREHGEECHIVNTASIGGFRIQPGWDTGPYSMTKYAVVALSEALEQDLEGSNIGVSVLCPAAVKTGIFLSGRSRPERMGGSFNRQESEQFSHLLNEGFEPDMIGKRVLRAIRNGEFFIFTHLWPRELIQARHDRLVRAFDDTQAWMDEEGIVNEEAAPKSN
ncbi:MULTISPECIES: SDR family NAD(P)-dependent oxidoreductase [unclassified Beijerinckia]|uniref:SDR family NAD(P)-dependent oxidoreductase n=1 Tax=unclassified Beijerinckia TaxID=2638183 RepID=UPI000897DA27|nr:MULTISPECIES: SDR family NAD(P)-dependent oxidoreductase [unclassified Beijerinckia]MDH7796760.1 NAD(P)-dependent dehydrogenase (short-subunit alcohol dehydrogenase family) [Beijerinckia sp. GAS462]SEC58740.1 NADP-dependent 3-hydroxy acid dehydrogenase YdfG [Beijerinckia sp. 28-YEA-48]